jgi:hypothetical protein
LYRFRSGLYRSSTIFNHISPIFFLFSTIFLPLAGSKRKASNGAGLKRFFALVLLLFIAEARWRVVSFLLLALSLARSGFLGGETRQNSKKKVAFFHEGAWRVVPPALPCR